MARKPKQTKDPTSLVISVVLHVLIIGGVVFWAYQTGRLEQVRQVLLQYASDKKKEEPKEQVKQPVQQRQSPQNLPPINTGQVPRSGGGTRRAVVSDAPEAAGDTFFQDTRKQVNGASTAGAGNEAPAAPQVKIIVPQAAPLISPFRAASSTTIKQLFADRAKQAAATEAFGSEQISKSGVSDAGAIINKVAGASIVDGKFAVIRGLSDRYVSTTLNGANVPSADPYRTSASLDMFPAQIISKVVVAKTFTPDQPGTYTGGGINIVTKSFPEKSFFSFSLGGSYNTQSTGNENFLTYPGGDFDWAGMDDGGRALPEELSGDDLDIPSPPLNSGSPSSSTYEQRLERATLVDQLTRAMGVVPFGPSREAAPFNHNFSVATGDTSTFLTRPFGYFASLSYGRGFSFYENGISQRWAPGAGLDELEIRKDFLDTRAVESVNWAGMVNLAYQVFDDDELGFTFLYNQNSENIARVQTGTIADDPGVNYTLNRLQFIERNLNTYQLKGTHPFEQLGNVRFDWLGSLSLTSQDEPDTRFFNFPDTYDLTKASTPEPRLPTRYFRELFEDNTNLKLDLTAPFRQWTMDDGEFKIGVFDSASMREFVDREIFYQGEAPFSGDPTQYLTEDNLGLIATTNSSGRVSYELNRYIGTRRSDYEGELGIRAGYAMLDLPVLPTVRLVGGVRYEMTDMSINSASYLPNSATSETTNSTVLEEAALLPSASLIWSLKPDMNFRLSYSQTIARPSFRELAAYRSYDPGLDEILEGNPLLQLSDIQNYDVRWEWFFAPGELVSISLFYKALENAIERRFITRDSDIISFENRETADVYGIEFEFRKNLAFIDPLLREFTVGGNLSLMDSSTPLTETELFNKRQTIGDVPNERPLYDQSPYLLNIDLSYDNVSSGTSASLIYNIVGPRIAIANPITLDTYDQPAASLDFILSQKLTRHLSVKLSARNLLDPVIERTVGEDGSRIYASYKRGRTFGISLAADF